MNCDEEKSGRKNTFTEMERRFVGSIGAVFFDQLGVCGILMGFISGLGGLRI